MLVNNAVDEFLMERPKTLHSENSFANERKLLREFVLMTQNNDLSLIDRHQVNNFLVWLQGSGICDNTFNQKVSSLRQFFKFCEKEIQKGISIFPPTLIF